MDDFRQQLSVAMDGIEAEIRRRHVQAARTALDRAVDARPVRPLVERVVDGRIGAALDSVAVPGVILFRLGVLQEVAARALVEAARLSPVRAGRYRDSWLALVDGKPHDGGPIGPDATLHIVNPQPYARKIQTRGARLANVAPGIVDRLANVLRAAYRGALRFDVTFIDLPGAYVLRRAAGRTTKSGRRARGGAKAGDRLRYPALAIRQVRSFD